MESGVSLFLVLGVIGWFVIKWFTNDDDHWKQRRKL